MKVVRPVLVVLLSWMLVAGGQAHATGRPAHVPSAPKVLVRFQPGMSPEQRAAIVTRLQGTIVGTIDALQIAIVQMNALADATALHQAAATLAQDPAVVYAAPNTPFTIADETPQASGGQRVFLPLAVGLAGWVPNDPRYGNQAYAWNQINAPAAWNVTRGSSSTVIAIVDTGILLNHPDLRDKIVAGYDFVDQDTTPMDGHGHGTHVAGLAAAESNNGIGVAGACPNCKLMPVRVLDDNGSGDLDTVAHGIVWAADHGARVINLSLTSPQDSPVLDDALNYAWQHGALPVCAAGNQNTNNPQVYPASNGHCVAVAATTADDVRASYSNYGPWVALAAPGDGVYSTWAWRAADGTLNASYEYNSGTSMATPFVAGTAGLLASTGLTNEQLRQRLCTTADQTPNTGAYWQCGRLDMYRAVRGR